METCRQLADPASDFRICQHTLSFKNIWVSQNPVRGEGFHYWPLEYKCNVSTIRVLCIQCNMYPMVSTGLAQEDRKWSQCDWKIIDWDVNNKTYKYAWQSLGSIFPNLCIQNIWHGAHGNRPTATFSRITHDKYFVA